MRVVRLPGNIWSTSNTTYVDRHQLNERGCYDRTFGQAGSTPILLTKISPGDNFMMKDKRRDSCDSRSFGTIAGSCSVGKVTTITFRNGGTLLHLLSSSP